MRWLQSIRNEVVERRIDAVVQRQHPADDVQVLLRPSGGPRLKDEVLQVVEVRVGRDDELLRARLLEGDRAGHRNFLPEDSRQTGLVRVRR